MPEGDWRDALGLLPYLPAAADCPAINSIDAEFLETPRYQTLAAIWRLQTDAGSTPSGPASRLSGVLTGDALKHWILADSRDFHLLSIRASECWDGCLSLLRQTLSSLGFTVKNGGLRIVSGEMLGKAGPVLPMGDEAVLAIMGLSECPVQNMPTALDAIETRVTEGKRTILVDRHSLPWDDDPRARMRWFAAATVELAWEGTIEPEEPESENDSEREVIRVVADVVARHFGVPAKNLFDRRSDKLTLKVRQAAIYIAREWGGFDFSLVGRVLGERTYVSATQAYRRIAERRTVDSDLDAKLTAIAKELSHLSQPVTEPGAEPGA